MKSTILLIFSFAFLRVFSQSPAVGIPDSVANVPLPGSTGAYTISNPLLHTGTAFSNPPVTVSCVFDCRADYLYFYDLDLSVPAGATITGVEVIHTRGGCNPGAYRIDTLMLAYAGAPIGAAKRDSANPVVTDTLGSSSDLWSAALTPAMVNHNSFGVFVQTTGPGICTYGQFNIVVKVYYTSCPVITSVGIPDSVSNEPYPGSTGAYNITNPLVHSGTAFTNPPITTTCVFDCKADYLYFYDFDLAVPPGASIQGIELLHEHGGCNSGSYMIDTIRLAYMGAPLGALKSDTANPNCTQLHGSSSDMWSAGLTPAMVNDNSFGVLINSSGTGICTHGQFNVVLTVYYCDGVTSSQAEIASGHGIRVYPNPAADLLTMEVLNLNVAHSFSLYDISGRLLRTGMIHNNKTEIETGSLRSGLYFIRVEGESQSVVKFVRE